MLNSAGIYLLDFENQAFIWIGKDVPQEVTAQAFELATNCLSVINCKGADRLMKMSMNVVFYGYEPEVFKNAFKRKWVRKDVSQFVK